LVAAIALSNCGGPNGASTDHATQALIKAVHNITRDSAVIEVTATDEDGFKSASLSVDTTPHAVTIPANAKSFDQNITVNNLTPGTNYTALLSVT